MKTAPYDRVYRMGRPIQPTDITSWRFSTAFHESAVKLGMINRTWQILVESLGPTMVYAFF